MSPATRVFAILCAIVFALSASTSAAITHTSVVLFSPWSSSGLRNDFIVSEKVKGSCWTHSLASERPDAWRCMADHDIYDPCFSGSPRKGTVACAEGPEGPDVQVVAAVADAAVATESAPAATRMALVRLS